MSNSSKTILLVEDEAIIAVIHRKILSRYGFNVITAVTGEKAVEIAGSNSEIDLILMDIDLGEGIDGTVAAERILAEKEIPLVFLSSHTEPDVVNRTEGITSYGYIVKNSGETVLIAAIKMAFRLFEAKLIVQSHLNQQEILVEILFELHKRMSQPFDDLINYTIEASVKLTNSTFGFTGLLSEDESVMTIHAWSDGVMNSCEIDKVPMHFPISDAGIWGECLRQRNPVIINDYDSYAGKRGYPEGHVPITNFMAVPIFDGDRIIAVGAVANSSIPYEISDVRCLISLYERLWEIIRRKQFEEVLQISEEKYRVLFEDSPEEYFIIDEGLIIDCNQAALFLMRSERDQIIGKSPYELSPEMQPCGMSSKDMMYDKLKEVLSKGKIVFQWLYARPNGTEFWAEVSLSVISLQNKSILFAGLRNISDKIFALSLMQKSLNRLKALLENSPSLIAIFDSEGRYIELSKTMANFYGMTTDGLRGKTFYDLLPHKVADNFIDKINEVKEGKELVITTDAIVLNGEERIFESRLFAIDVEDEEKELYCSIAVDITTRIKFEADKQREVKVNRALVAASKLILQSNDFLHTARSIFDAVCDLTGAISGYVALLNENGDENEVLFLESGGYKCTVDPSLPMPIRGLRSVAYHSKKAVYDNNFESSEWMEYMPEGHSPLVNVLFAPLLVDGKAVGLLGIANKPEPFTDDDLKLAEMFADMAAIALNNSRLYEFILDEKNKYKRLFDSANNAIFLNLITENNMPGAFIEANERACEMLQYTLDELLQLTVMEISPAEVWENMEEIIDELMRNGEMIFESKHVRKDGSIFTVEISAILFKDGERKIVLSHCRDITERKDAEDKIILLLKETHHRIKNNMNTVYGLLYMQAEELSDPVSRNIIMDAATRIQSMMVLYDKLYRAEDQHEMNVNDYLPALVDEIISIFDSRIPVKTDINVDDIVLSAKVISTLGIIINELITNSMKYAFNSTNEGLIVLLFTEKENKVAIVYRDNGPGIPESVNFENSTGFGMQLIGMLVNQLGGEISIDRGEAGGIIINFSI